MLTFVHIYDRKIPGKPIYGEEGRGAQRCDHGMLTITRFTVGRHSLHPGAIPACSPQSGIKLIIPAPTNVSQDVQNDDTFSPGNLRISKVVKRH